MILEQASLYEKKGSAHPLPEFCNVEGAGLEQWVTIKEVIGQRPSTHEFGDIFRCSTSCAAVILDRRVFWGSG